MQNKIDRKYYVWIWLGFIFAAFVRNIYPIYSDIIAMGQETSRLDAIRGTLSIVFTYGLIPAVVTFVLSLILYYICARRHANYITRNDFCYWVMIFTTAEKLLAGIIESFAILDGNVYVFTSTVLDALLLPAAYLTMYLWIFAKKYKFNPVERRNSFSVLSTVYMIVYGIDVLVTNLAIVAIGTDKELASEIAEILKNAGYLIGEVTSELQTISSAIAICVFFAYLVAVIVLSIVFRKKADEFRDSDTREAYFEKHSSDRGYDQRDDISDTFDEFERQHVHKKGGDSNDDSNDDSHVFDEFDI